MKTTDLKPIHNPDEPLKFSGYMACGHVPLDEFKAAVLLRLGVSGAVADLSNCEHVYFCSESDSIGNEQCEEAVKDNCCEPVTAWNFDPA